ncbi:PH domain-containing protein [Nesterenkonia suensis]
MHIEKDTRPVAASLAWSWILAFIPTLFVWLKVASVETTVSGKTVTQRRGFVGKQYANVDLAKVQNINGAESLFKGGSLTFHTTAGQEEFLYIKDPQKVANQLRALAD